MPASRCDPWHSRHAGRSAIMTGRATHEARDPARSFDSTCAQFKLTARVSRGSPCARRPASHSIGFIAIPATCVRQMSHFAFTGSQAARCRRRAEARIVPVECTDSPLSALPSIARNARTLPSADDRQVQDTCRISTRFESIGRFPRRNR